MTAARPRRIVVLAEQALDFHHGKTATSLLRYRPDDVVAVIDSANEGRTANDVIGIGGDIPIVSDIEHALSFEPTELVIGIAPRGGGLPDGWRGQILRAIGAGLDVVSGLHYVLNEDAELATAARAANVKLVDVREPPTDLGVATLAARREGARVITFVGSDCAVGKMTAALETAAAAKRRGLSTAFVATGQTGIMLEGSGISIDRVIGDFMAGATEQLVTRAAEDADWVFVEGQGSLLHPGYSGVTLALLHGSSPDGMILVHQPSHEKIEEYPVDIPPIDRLVRLYEDAAGWVKPAPVVAIALNTRDLDSGLTAQAIEHTARATGLPVTDPIKFGGDVLVEGVVTALSKPAVA